MRQKSYYYDERTKPEVIAGFGTAELVRHLDGRFELRGGSAEDHRAAREWVEQFYRKALYALPSPPDRPQK